jgi:hypothetical protein
VREKNLATPLAIIIAGALVGTGVFFGLRQREAPRGAPPSSVAVEAAPAGTARAPAEPPAPLRPSPAPNAPTVSRDKVARDAAAALEAQRRDLGRKCWEPAVSLHPTSKSTKWVFNLSFDAEGNQTVRGVAEDRPTSRPDVTVCVLAALQPLKIPPPGAPAYVEVPFSLP